VSHSVAKLSATEGNQTVRSVGVLLVGLLSGCALAPGMRMDERAAEDRARRKDAKFSIRPITAGLIAALAEERSKEDARSPDPLGNAPPAPYTVAPHDVLQVTVWAHPELTVPTGQFRSPEENGIPVLADGTMYYPYVGIIEVRGKTLREIRNLLANRLAGVIPNPQLDVRIAAFRGKKVQVTGEVAAPTTMPITDVPARVQDAIAFARGLGPEADLSAVTLSREGRVHRLDLHAFYERGDTSQNWLLRDGDIINVPDRNRNRVFIMGEVRRQQARLMVKRRMTLAEAIGDSEGFDPSAANVARIYVIRGDFDAPGIFRLDASSADALLLATQFELKPRDVVYVSTYEVTRWNRVMSQIVPTVQTLFNAAILYDIATRD
jgi:polysaccharide export outer membrane protein